MYGTVDLMFCAIMWMARKWYNSDIMNISLFYLNPYFLRID